MWEELLESLGVVFTVLKLECDENGCLEIGEIGCDVYLGRERKN